MNEIKISDNFILDRASIRDTARLVELLNEPVFEQMTRSIPYPYTSQDAKQWIHANLAKEDADPTKVWSIRKGNPLKLCGMVGVYRAYNEGARMEVGYWIGKPYWGKGVATQALEKLLAYLEDVYQCKDFIAHTLVNNPSSMRVLKKNGFVKVDFIENHIDHIDDREDKCSSAFLWQKKK